jgi:ribosomal protein S18 acetylase RimI-like enzyme
MTHTFPLHSRPATEEDLPFLMALRRLTMREHLLKAGASAEEEQMSARVRVRFDCARILLHGGEAVGLLKLVREGPVWELVQIQLSPALQGRGLGRRVIEAVLDDARRNGAAVSLSVLKGSPARRLYERLGFRVVNSGEVADEMLWQA